MNDFKKIMVRGTPRYMHNKKFIKKADVPADVLVALETQDTAPAPVTEIVETKKPEDRNCIFCGEYTTWKKMVNLQTVAICEAHYYSESTGKVAQKIREMANV